MLPLIYTTPLYIITFVSLTVISRVPETIITVRRSAQRDSSTRTEGRGSIAVLVVVTGGGVIAACILAAVWTRAAIPWFRPQVTLAGIGVMLLGAALRYWSIITLGRYFTFVVAVRSTQSVIQSGPYRLVRHPAYSGILVILFGLGLVLANWASLILLLTTGLIGLLYRVSVEERALVATLGQPYVDYMRHTRRFIPFLL